MIASFNHDKSVLLFLAFKVTNIQSKWPDIVLANLLKKHYRIWIYMPVIKQN